MELTKLIEWVRHQTVLQRGEELAAEILRPEKVTSLRTKKTREPELVDPPPVAAVGQPTRPPGGARKGLRPPRGGARAPDPLVKEFSGCFHCGEPGHSRRPNPRTGSKGCEKFQAYLKSKGGTLPNDYEVS